MNVLNRSLRLRLLILILLPMLVIAAGTVYWRFKVARKIAEDIFDRNLIMMNLAISRDVALSGGDSLSQVTTNLFRDATGGDIYYHVYGPDGSFVTGYSSPPVYTKSTAPEFGTPILFDASHLGQPIRVARLAERTSIDGISGVSVVTVWQPLKPRQDFAARMVRQAAIIATLLLSSVALLIFFGIRFGLRPLKELESAITKRSSQDLRPIERQVPQEAKSIVARLNNLFSQLNEANQARERLVSNAAHQLRNPIAAVHSLATATANAESKADMKERAIELLSEARRAAHLTEQLLSFERLHDLDPKSECADIVAFLTQHAAEVGPHILRQNIDFELDVPNTAIFTHFNPTLLGEALRNLIDNAITHGGRKLGKISLSLKSQDKSVLIHVINDGKAIKPDDETRIFERFSQGYKSEGAGLGLSIVSEIMDKHNGDIALLQNDAQMVKFQIRLPSK